MSSVDGGEDPRPVIGNYRIIRTINKGSFGKVKEAIFLPTGDKVAVKIINRQQLMGNAAMDAKIEREIRILKLFSHPTICRLYDVISTPTDILMVMELINGKELYDVIVERGMLPEAEARYIFQQLLCAVEYWHHYRVVHRDLKPENILLEPDLTVKVIDFGLANVNEDGVFLRTSCGSPNYAAPEVISGRMYAGPEIDTWSSGVILYALLCGCLPFDEETIPLLFKRIKSGEFKVPEHVSPNAHDLIKRMLTVDPLDRITIPQIRDHPWFLVALPRYLGRSSFVNARIVDPMLFAQVAAFTNATPAEVADAVERSERAPPATQRQKSLQVTYNVLFDKKRRMEIEEIKRRDRTGAGSNASGSTAGPFGKKTSGPQAVRELNLGLMLTSSPAVNAMLDGGDAAVAREYNNQSYVPPSMQDARALSNGSLRTTTNAPAGGAAGGPGGPTLCFAGDPLNYTDRVGSLQQSLASAPRTLSSSTAPRPAATSPAASSNSGAVVGSVAKAHRAYAAEDAHLARENNVGWRVGVMSDRPSASLMSGVLTLLKESGYEWRTPSPFVLHVRHPSERGTVVKVMVMRLAEKHAQGYVIDFSLIAGSNVIALQNCMAMATKVVYRLD